MRLRRKWHPVFCHFSTFNRRLKVQNPRKSRRVQLTGQTLKVGDRIEVGGVLGDVVKLSLRAATIRTNDNIEIIVPNNEFINGNVVNWSHSSRDVRVIIPVGVSYSSDPETVRQCLLKAAKDYDEVLHYPEPDVVFEGFGDSALNFELRVYTNTMSSKPKLLKSNLNFKIFKELAEADIEIPFPQRDLHIRSSYFQGGNGDNGKKNEALLAEALKSQN